MAVADQSTQQTQARGTSLARNVPLLLASALVVVGLAGLLPLRLSTNATTTSDSIRRLEQMKADWQVRNLQLENEIAAQGSLDRTEREARAWGMIPATNGVPIAVDLKWTPTPHIPSRFLPPEPAKPHSPRPWWRNVLELLPLP